MSAESRAGSRESSGGNWSSDRTRLKNSSGSLSSWSGMILTSKHCLLDALSKVSVRSRSRMKSSCDSEKSRVE